MQINHRASAVWAGGLKDGKGAISTESGALAAYPYGFTSRFEGKRGTNPKELLGAVHAGCFTMAFSLILGEVGFTATEMETQAKVTLEQGEGGYALSSILKCNAGRWKEAEAVRVTGPTVERSMKSGRVPGTRNERAGLAVQRAAATLVESRRQRAARNAARCVYPDGAKKTSAGVR